MIKTTRRLPLLAAVGIAAALVANVASAYQPPENRATTGHWASQGSEQMGPTIGTITGGGTSNAEMDHSKMGAMSPSAVGQTGPTTGEGTSGAVMDHSRMGAVQGPGGSAAIGPTSGSGTADAEITHGPGIGPPQS